jgi:hypothetical protein
VELGNLERHKEGGGEIGGVGVDEREVIAKKRDGEIV